MVYMATTKYNLKEISLKLAMILLVLLFALIFFMPVSAREAVKFKKNNSLSQKEQLAKVRQHILNNKLPQIALDRLDAFETQQKKIPKRKNLLTRVSDFVTGNADLAKEKKEAMEFAKKAPFKVETFEGKINLAPEKNYEKTFKNGTEQVSLTKKTLELLVRIFDKQEALAEASDDPNDYLAPGGEITFSQAIKDEANALKKDPLTMLNFVRNEVKYLPYYGSKKGSDATLVELAGNDLDKASLLIAMLRYSNIPARYRRVDAKMNIRAVTDLLGVDSAMAAARVLSLGKIPYTLYTQNEDPVFFVVEHTYVEAYMPYGYSRGIDLNDGGVPQWVPMDPSINAYYYEQLVDLIEGMNNDGFDIKVFFENYLEGNYGTSEPLDAFKSEVVSRLPAITPEYYPNLTYEDALTHFYPKIQNLEFIPGSLPFDISANLDTYDYLPATLRHTINFTVKDKDDNIVLTHTAYVSDLADRELLVTYKAATSSDQAVIDTFETIYDVVPLSLVAVKPVIKINGMVVATSATSTTLGQTQKYTMDFSIPTRKLGGLIIANIAETLEESTLTGTANAIAFNTDRVIPPELRPTQDTASGSYMSDQMLYRTAVDYLDRLQYTHGELANIIGSDFTHTATAAVISNGIGVTNNNGQPYSFDWKGLRIDSSSSVRYFNRFNEDVTKYKGEFVALFALQASQDESDIFEDNFNVESVATVKGLKLVSKGQFPGITMKKITSANQNEIDSLQISSTTKTAFHTAIADGKTIYTPTKPVTYGQWQGLFYITTNFYDEATYAIGEGLNGGYSVCGLPGVGGICEWTQGWVDYLKKNYITTTATILSPADNQNYMLGDDINFEIQYKYILGGVTVHQWNERGTISTNNLGTGTKILISSYGTNKSVEVTISRVIIGTEGENGNNDPTFDVDISDAVKIAELPTTAPDFEKILKLVIKKETGNDPKKMRYEPCTDKDFTATNAILNQHPWSAWRLPGKRPDGTEVSKGSQVDSLKINHGMTPYEMLEKIPDFGMDLTDNDNDGIVETTDNDGTLSIYEIWKNNDNRHRFTTASLCGSDKISEITASQPAQFLISSSYGLGQVVYRWFAKDFDPSTSPPAADIWEMFSIRPNVIISAKALKGMWNSTSGIQGVGCNKNDRLWTTIAKYNSGGTISTRSSEYADLVCTYYKGQ